MGRRSIFPNKDDKYRKQGQMTRSGHLAFEAARKRLCELVLDTQGWRPRHVSDGDVMEFLGRGEQGTRDHLSQDR